MGFWNWLVGDEARDHECAYSCGEDYPEHCIYCGRSILSDPSYRRDTQEHVRENVDRARRGESPIWAIDRRVL